MSERTGIGHSCVECSFQIIEGQPWAESAWGFCHAVCLEAAQNGVGL